MVGKIPSCVLHITIPCEIVDVNVHPAKTEVRFVNEKPIFDAVYHGSKTALIKNDTPKEISLKAEDIIPHKQPNPFSFEKPYSKKSEPSVQLTLIGAEKYNQVKISDTNKQAETVFTESKPVVKSETYTSNIPTKSTDEPQLFIPKAKPFVRTESLFSNTVVNDSVTDYYNTHTATPKQAEGA